MKNRLIRGEPRVSGAATSPTRTVAVLENTLSSNKARRTPMIKDSERLVYSE